MFLHACKLLFKSIALVKRRVSLMLRFSYIGNHDILKFFFLNNSRARIPLKTLFTLFPLLLLFFLFLFLYFFPNDKLNIFLHSFLKSRGNDVVEWNRSSVRRQLKRNNFIPLLVSPTISPKKHKLYCIKS